MYPLKDYIKVLDRMKKVGEELLDNHQSYYISLRTPVLLEP